MVDYFQLTWQHIKGRLVFYTNIVGSKIKVAFKVDDNAKNDYKFFDKVLLSSTGC